MARPAILRFLPSHVVRVSSRSYSATVDIQDAEWSRAKSFHEIPGPKPLPIPKVGNIWRMLPFGTYGGLPLMKLHQTLFNEFGPIVNLKGVGRQDIVFVYNPEDAEKIFRADSAWPYRFALESFEYYRRITRADVFQGNPGITTSQGEEWHQNRIAANMHMLKPSNVSLYIRPIECVANDFIKRIEFIRESSMDMPDDFMNEMRKWSLESISLVSLDTRLGCFDKDLMKDSEPQSIIDSANKVMRLIYKLDILPSLWKFYPTADWRNFVKAMNNVTEISLTKINKKVEDIKSREFIEGHQKSILENILAGTGGHLRAITLAIDTMIAGVDTTSNSATVALYYIAKHPEVQDKIYQEVKQLMPNINDQLPDDFQKRIPYIKACIKEGQRITPLVVGSSRRLTKDLVLSGYQIPKGTDTVLLHSVMSNEEEHFKNADKYIPERWLKSDTTSPLSAKHVHPFVFLPFGFGPRMCIGRRFAELEIQTLVAKLVRHFKISYHHEDMEWFSEITVIPSKPVKLRFENREQ